VIDLHCHMLPGIDDGAQDMDAALTMARIAVADGITTSACTPHIYAGLYDNTADSIMLALSEFRRQLVNAEIPLEITYGADTHLAPDLVEGLRSKRIPSLHGSRYFLLEPPHHVAPPRLEESVFELLAAGYVPVITHPERLSWISDHHEKFCNMARRGAWLQVTAGSLTGDFGSKAQYWAERLLDEGLIHILASDAHSVDHRPPILTKGVQVVEQTLGSQEAELVVITRPQGVLNNLDPSQLAPPPGLMADKVHKPTPKRSLLKGLFGFS